MTGHTPEPWGPFDDPPLTRITLNKYDYDRARACVNACAGIPTEQLEGGDVLELIDAVIHYMGPKSDPETAWEDMKAALAPFRED